jgi:hypothetical protein
MAEELTAEISLHLFNMMNAPKRVLEEMVDAYNEYLHFVFKLSQELVPVDTGDLMISGQVDDAVLRDENTVGGSITYGDNLVDYAVIVHEDLDAYHEYPTQAKYLEQPFTDNFPDLVEDVKRRIRKALKE